MANIYPKIYPKGLVTVFGANMGPNTAGKTALGVTSVDMISVALNNNFTVTEQPNSEGNIAGVVGSNIRDDLTLTFYPLPTAQTTAGFQGIKLPPLGTVITLEQTTPTGGLETEANVPSTVLGAYNYIGGGKMDFQQGGLMTMTLPLRQYNGVALT